MHSYVQKLNKLTWFTYIFHDISGDCVKWHNSKTIFSCMDALVRIGERTNGRWFLHMHRLEFLCAFESMRVHSIFFLSLSIPFEFFCFVDIRYAEVVAAVFHMHMCCRHTSELRWKTVENKKFIIRTGWVVCFMAMGKPERIRNISNCDTLIHAKGIERRRRNTKSSLQCSETGNTLLIHRNKTALIRNVNKWCDMFPPKLLQPMKIRNVQSHHKITQWKLVDAHLLKNHKLLMWSFIELTRIIRP